MCWCCCCHNTFVAPVTPFQPPRLCFSSSHPSHLPAKLSLRLFLSVFFLLIHKFHSISFTRAQSIPKCKIGFGGGGRMGEFHWCYASLARVGLAFCSSMQMYRQLRCPVVLVELAAVVRPVRTGPDWVSCPPLCPSPLRATCGPTCHTVSRCCPVCCPGCLPSLTLERT
jgi:hypothetical protein